MIRSLFVTSALLIGVSAVVAQEDPISSRKALMKSVGAATSNRRSNIVPRGRSNRRPVRQHDLTAHQRKTIGNVIACRLSGFARVSAPRPADGTKFNSETDDAGPLVRLPGEPERETKARRLQEGIPLDAATWQEIAAAAEQAGVRI
jgi:hypothetical protein